MARLTRAKDESAGTEGGPATWVRWRRARGKQESHRAARSLESANHLVGVGARGEELSVGGLVLFPHERIHARALGALQHLTARALLIDATLRRDQLLRQWQSWQSGGRAHEEDGLIGSHWGASRLIGSHWGASRLIGSHWGASRLIGSHWGASRRIGSHWGASRLIGSHWGASRLIGSHWGASRHASAGRVLAGGESAGQASAGQASTEHALAGLGSWARARVSCAGMLGTR